VLPSLRVNHQLEPVLVMTSGKKLAGAQSLLIAPMLEEKGREEPRDREEEVYQEEPGVAQVVLIEQTEAAKPETRWGLPVEQNQRLNRQLVTRVQVILRTGWWAGEGEQHL